MRTLACLAAFVVLGSIGCGTEVGDEDEAAAADSAFTQAQCAPVRTTESLDEPGAAQSNLRRCVRASAGGGQALMQRAVAFLADTQRFASIEQDNGEPAFARFNPRRANGETQEIDVSLNVDHRPSARLRVTRRTLPDGRYQALITNVTPFSAWGITAIPRDGFRLELFLRADDTGLLITGTSSIRISLDQAQREAPAASQSVFGLFDLLNAELTGPTG